MASSSESCGLSSRRTTSSRRARERSNSGFFGGSGFLAAGEFTLYQPVSFSVLISGNARSSKWTGRFGQCAGWVARSVGRDFLHGRKREEFFPIPETTMPDRESQAPDVDSILRHA